MFGMSFFLMIPRFSLLQSMYLQTVERKMTFFRTISGEFAALRNVTIRLIELSLRLVICSISSS